VYVSMRATSPPEVNTTRSTALSCVCWECDCSTTTRLFSSGTETLCSLSFNALTNCYFPCFDALFAAILVKFLVIEDCLEHSRRTETHLIVCVGIAIVSGIARQLLIRACGLRRYTPNSVSS